MTITHLVYAKPYNLRSQVGAPGLNIALNEASRFRNKVSIGLILFRMHVATSAPMSSNPLSHVYVAVSPLKAELPVVATFPLSGAIGSGHNAENRE